MTEEEIRELEQEPEPPPISVRSRTIEVKNATSTCVAGIETLFETPKPGVSAFQTQFQTQKHRFKRRSTPFSTTIIVYAHFRWAAVFLLEQVSMN